MAQHQHTAEQLASATPQAANMATHRPGRKRRCSASAATDQSHPARRFCCRTNKSGSEAKDCRIKQGEARYRPERITIAYGTIFVALLLQIKPGGKHLQWAQHTGETVARAPRARQFESRIAAGVEIGAHDRGRCATGSHIHQPRLRAHELRVLRGRRSMKVARARVDCAKSACRRRSREPRYNRKWTYHGEAHDVIRNGSGGQR